ncbi:MAG: hypothetical protein LBF28_00520 [Rickettsiales bacterium]|jgi:outer membrane murein-binding lipoprotein Lpp|nr:hypothetical protein [Rickettsiales bacterium]
MKTNKLIIGTLAAILVAFGANAESLKGIKNAATDSIAKVEQLEKELAALRKDPNVSKYEKANSSATECAKYDGAYYVEVNSNRKCVDENPCLTKDKSIQSACDTTYKEVMVDGADIANFLVQAKDKGCKITEKDIDTVFGKYNQDTATCKASGKVYVFGSLNASLKKNDANGHAAGLCIAMGGKPGESLTAAKRKWIKCSVAQAKCTTPSGAPTDLGARTIRFDDFTDTCMISLS